jgi:hypothetical protein
MKSNRCLVRILAFVLLGIFGSLHAQNFVLNAPMSPEANGTAGLYTSSNTDDPLAPISNPALLGLMAERNRLMVGFYPQRMSWGVLPRPEGGYDFTMTHSARSLYLGFDRATLDKYFKTNLPLSFGIGYQEVYYNMGELDGVDPSGNVISHYHSYERSRGYTMSAAAHYRYVQASIGLGQRFTTLNYPIGVGAIHLTSSDLGLYVQSPLERLFYKRDLVSDGRALYVRPFCTPAVSYALMNLGSRYMFPTTDIRQPPPREAKLGWNVSAGAHAAHPVSGQDWRLISVAYGVEAEDALVARDGYHYQGLFGDIRPGTNLLLGKRNDGVLLRQGFEIGVAELVYYRSGASHGTGGNGYFSDMTTKG